MINTISTVFLLTVLITPTFSSSSSSRTSTSLLLTLLEPHLLTATCHARCVGLPSEEREDCLALCLEVLEDPTSPSLCDFPRLCTGGCRAACDSSREERRELRLRVSQQTCLLSWEMEQTSPSSPSSLVYVVAGLDQGGKLNLVSSLQLDSSLPLSPASTQKYKEMTVLAVDRQGLLQVETVQIQEVQTCPLSTQDDKLSQTPAEFVDTNLVHICLVVIISTILLTILIIKIVRTVRTVQPGKQTVKKESLEDVFYSDNIFLICRESLSEDVKYLNLV